MTNEELLSQLRRMASDVYNAKDEYQRTTMWWAGAAAIWTFGGELGLWILFTGPLGWSPPWAVFGVMAVGIVCFSGLAYYQGRTIESRSLGISALRTVDEISKRLNRLE